MNAADAPAPGAPIQVHRSAERERYWLQQSPAEGAGEQAGQTLGLLLYSDAVAADGTRVRDLRSTVVPTEHSGRGYGSRLVRAAVEDARAEGVRLTATCWFARGWLERHREHEDLLATAEQRRSAADDADLDGKEHRL